MADYTLTKTRRNDVLKVLVAAQIDPRGFDWTVEQDGDSFSILVHLTTGSYFSFRPTNCECSPSAKLRPDYDVHLGEWSRQLKLLEKWTPYLKPEIEEPDLWESLTQDVSEAATSFDTENRLFSPVEQGFVAEQLILIQNAIIEGHALQQAQIAALTAGVTYLIESSKRMGRKDWINLAVGTIVNIAVAASFAPEAGRDLLHMLTSSLQSLFTVAARMIGPG